MLSTLSWRGRIILIILKSFFIPLISIFMFLFIIAKYDLYVLRKNDMTIIKNNAPMINDPFVLRQRNQRQGPTVSKYHCCHNVSIPFYTVNLKCIALYPLYNYCSKLNVWPPLPRVEEHSHMICLNTQCTSLLLCYRNSSHCKNINATKNYLFFSIIHMWLAAHSPFISGPFQYPLLLYEN